MGCAQGKRKGGTYPQFARRAGGLVRSPPAAIDDVPDFGDPSAIGVGNAAVGSAAVTKGKEAGASPFQQGTRFRVGPANGGAVEACHLAVQGGEFRAVADRDFAAGAGAR